MGQEKQWGKVKGQQIAVKPHKVWFIPHSREQIAADEAQAEKRTAEIFRNLAAGKRN